MSSPELRVSSRPVRSEKPRKPRRKVRDWKKIVAFTWDHLDKNYEIDEPKATFTTIYTWSPSNRYTQGGEDSFVPKLKGLCTAIIHFEDILHQVMKCTDPPPEGFLELFHFRRNWRENPNLGELPLTQAQSIYQIEAIDAKLENMDRLLQSIQPARYKYDDDYCWNIKGFFRKYDPDYGGDAMFFTSRACTSAAWAINWIETVTLFVRAAVSCPASLLGNRKYPPNLQGFARFLQGNHRPDGANWRGDLGGDTSSSSESE